VIEAPDEWYRVAMPAVPVNQHDKEQSRDTGRDAEHP